MIIYIFNNGKFITIYHRCKYQSRSHVMFSISNDKYEDYVRYHICSNSGQGKLISYPYFLDININQMIFYAHVFTTK